MTMITIKILNSNMEIVPLEVDDQSSFYLNIYSTHVPYADNFINNDQNQGLDIYFVEIGTDQWKLKTYGSITYFEDAKKVELLASLDTEKQRRLELIATQEEINAALTNAVIILCKENEQLRLVLQNSLINQPYPITPEEIATLADYRDKSLAINNIKAKYLIIKAEIEALVLLEDMNAYNVADDTKWQ